MHNLQLYRKLTKLDTIPKQTCTRRECEKLCFLNLILFCYAIVCFWSLLEEERWKMEFCSAWLTFFALLCIHSRKDKPLWIHLNVWQYLFLATIVGQSEHRFQTKCNHLTIAVDSRFWIWFWTNRVHIHLLDHNITLFPKDKHHETVANLCLFVIDLKILAF